MRRRTILGGLVAAAVVGTTAVVATAPAEAVVKYITKPIYSKISTDARSARVMAVLNASTGNSAPLIQAPYSTAKPYNDIMVLEVEANNVVRIKPRHTFSDDGNPHNDKCLAIKNNTSRKGQPIVNATCTYDGVNNDVWRMTKYFEAGTNRELLRFSNYGLNWCISAPSGTSNVALVTDLCGVAGTTWTHYK